MLNGTNFVVIIPNPRYKYGPSDLANNLLRSETFFASTMATMTGPQENLGWVIKIIYEKAL